MEIAQINPEKPRFENDQTEVSTKDIGMHEVVLQNKEILLMQYENRTQEVYSKMLGHISKDIRDATEKLDKAFSQ